MATKKIATLTPDQQERLAEFRAKWLSVGCSTVPADRQRAQAAILELYRLIGKPDPVFLWLESPMACCVAIGLLRQLSEQLSDQLLDQLSSQLTEQLRDQLSDQLSNQLSNQLWVQLRAQLSEQLSDQLWAQLSDQLSNQLWVQLTDRLTDRLTGQLKGQLWVQLRAQLSEQLSDQLSNQLSNQLWVQLRSQLSDRLTGQLKGQLWDQLSDQLREQANEVVYACFWGQQEVPWIAFYEFAYEIGAKYHKEQESLLTIWAELAKSGGWWWPFDGLCICSERPTAIHWDDTQRLHGPDGPAVEFKDGFALHSWHGVRVPRRLIENPDSFTAEEIQGETNSEISRVLAEKLGWERYLERAGVVVIDRWSDPRSGLDYELLDTLRRKGDSQPRFLRMRSPALHNGSQPWFIEPVDPGLQSAQAARKWQCRLSRDQNARYYRHGDVVVVYAAPDTLYWPTADEANADPTLNFIEER